MGGCLLCMSVPSVMSSATVCREKLLQSQYESKENISNKSCSFRSNVIASDTRMNGTNLIAGFWEYNDSPETNRIWLKMGKTFLDELGHYLNFTYNVTVISPEKDAIQYVYNKKVDVLINILTVTMKRKRYVKFLEPLYETYKTFTIKTPQPVSLFTMLAPFDMPTWLAVVAFSIVAAVIMALEGSVYLNWVSSKDSPLNLEARSFRKSLQFYVFQIISCLVQQSSVWLPKKLAPRTLLGCWWIFAVEIAAFYCAVMVSLLTISQSEQPFNSVAELVAHPTLQPVVVDGQSVIEVLSDSPKGSDLGNLWKKVASDEENSIVISMKDGAELSLYSQYTLLGNAVEIILTLVEQRQQVFGYDANGALFCNLILSPVKFFPARMAWMVPKKSPYSELLDNGLKSIISGGLRDKWFREAFPEELEKCLNPPKQAIRMQPLSFVQYTSTFYMGMYGGIASLLLLAMEYVIWKLANSRKFN